MSEIIKKYHVRKILLSGFIAGVLLFVASYGGLYLGIRFLPDLFLEYNNPLFNSDGSRDWLFYSHAFIISFALSAFWQRFKTLFHGAAIVRGIEFGFVYALVSLLPVMWITFSSLDITVAMVISWFGYGLMQAIVAGLVFARINP